MLALGIIVCYLLGLSVLLVISRKYSLAELLGFSFLLGMGLETVILFLLDLVNVQYSQGIILAVNFIAIAAICASNYKNLVALKNEFKMPAFDIRQINFAALFIFGVLAYLFYAVTVKNLFWPTAEHDSIGSFDKLGKVMAIEGKLKISLFQYHLEGAGGIYPPLFHASLAYVYIFGALTSKITTTFYFFSLLCCFYGLLRNYVDTTAAMLFTFLLMITPELFSHAALSLDNMPTTAYAGPGALATFTWLDKRDKRYFWLGAIFIAFSIWIRSDTLVFPAAAILIMGIDLLRRKDWKNTFIYGAIAIAPFIIWTLYLKLKIHSAQEARFDFGIGYNAERMHLMMGYLKAYLFGGTMGRVDGGQLFGLTFILFFLMILVNIGFIYKAGWRKIANDKLYVLVFFFVSLGLYFTIFYLINEKTQNAPISSLMESSFKRGMFCFVPVAWFYIATNYASMLGFGWLERFRNPAP